MNNKINIKLDHRGGSWEYHGHLIFDIKDQEGSQILRVGVYINGDKGNLKIFVAVLKIDAPLPNGVNEDQYLNIVSTLEDGGFLVGLSDEDQDTPIDYAIFSDPEFHNISSSPEDSGYEREINDWLMNFLVDDGLLTKINTMIESVRNKTKSTKD